MTLRIEEWRRAERKETMVGVMLALRHCRKCGQFKAQDGGKFTKGTSRHNPGYFTCKPCLGVV